MASDDELIQIMLNRNPAQIDGDSMFQLAELMYERYMLKHERCKGNCWLKWVGLVYAQHGFFTENFQKAYFGKIFRKGGLEDLGI